ncbi:MAG: hypothetical protein QXE81_05815 [Desulfurococcaceae archaeon]
MSKETTNYTIEITIGLFLMFLAWIIIFLIVLQVIMPPADWVIALSIICYALSLMGLALSIHGLFSAIIVKRRRIKQPTLS